MYLIVYKTAHINGKYYIGRHETTNLNDGYLGSGKWVQSIKNKSNLSRTIIAEATTFEELCKLEEHYISVHFDDPLCMNYKRASIGWNSADIKDRVLQGTHNFCGSFLNKRRVENGTHHFVGGEFQRTRVANGTHNLVGDSNPTYKRLKEGTHNFLGDSNPGGDASRNRVANGTHNFQQTWVCQHCKKSGQGTNNLARWHGDNCKLFKIVSDPR